MDIKNTEDVAESIPIRRGNAIGRTITSQ